MSNLISPIGKGFRMQQMTAKTPAERVADLRAHRLLLGLRRLELYAHPDHHKAIKQFAARLARKVPGYSKERG